MTKEFIGFDWDTGNIGKILKRFKLQEVEKFFEQEIFVIKDESHSQNEARYIAVGIGPEKRPMFVCFTYRYGKIRVISARFMRGKEVNKYENFKKNHQEN